MSPPRRLTTWCRLLRLPNLFTVPGDPLAGFMLATGGVLDWRVAGAMATSLLLYCAGLLLNDYFDRHIDARERPDRPIPSGAAKAGAVLAVGLVLLVLGVGVAFAVGHAGAGAVAIALALAVFAYDAVLKRVPWLGPVVMGSCRAGSVVLGAAFVARPMAPPVVAAAGLMWVYISTVTLLASKETSSKPLGDTAIAPFAILVVGGCLLDAFILQPQWPVVVWAFGVLAIAAYLCGRGAWLVHRGRLPAPAFIGQLIRAVIPVQAAWSIWLIPLRHAVTMFQVLAVFALLYLGAAIASRRFYGS